MNIASAKETLASLLGIAYPRPVAISICRRSSQHHGHDDMQFLSAVAQLVEADEIEIVVGARMAYRATAKMVSRRDAEVEAMLK